MLFYSKTSITSRRYGLGIFIMLSLISQLCANPAYAKSSTKSHPRQINLSGNIFHFSMPEDFSKDMPAYDMVERLDISDPQKFDNPEYGNLIRRWWDIKKPGWFGKQMGTVMMNISVQRVPENKAKSISDQPYDIRKRVDFLMMIDDLFHQRYDKMNAEILQRTSTEQISDNYHFPFATLSGRELNSRSIDITANGQKWTGRSTSAPRAELRLHQFLPLTEHLFIEVSFFYAPNRRVAAREFDSIAQAKMKTIGDSFKVDFAVSNPMANLVESKWLNQTNNEVFNENRHEILKLFLGPDPEAALLKQDEEMRIINEKIQNGTWGEEESNKLEGH